MRRIGWRHVGFGLLLASGPSGADDASTSWQSDGRLDEAEWSQAEVLTEFQQTQPLTLAAARWRTEARWLATEAGLRVGMRAWQPAAVTAQRSQRPRDAETLGADILYVMIDPGGDGRSGFEFTVSRGGTQRDGTISADNQFSYDWDATWFSAVHEYDDGFGIEWLIPWNVLPPRQDDGATRRMAVQFGRFVSTLGERYAYPAASWERPRYLPEFYPIDVPVFENAALSIVPYLSLARDFRQSTRHARAGADLRWQPGSGMLVAAAINPDFGQVEADDLVVNFDAIEVFRGDKRPFFTEDQSLFEVNTPRDDRLLYTRRIGGERDDGIGAAEIDAALKLSGEVGDWRLGTLLARESDTDGRDFTVLRGLRSGEQWDLGQFYSRTDRPALDRDAQVYAVDLRWRPNSRHTLLATGLRSQTDQAGDTNDGNGGFVSWLYSPSPTWKHDVTLTRYNKGLDLNDAGLLYRDNLDQLYTSASYRRTPGNGLAAVTWGATHSDMRDRSGLRLRGFNYLSRTAEREGGGTFYTELRYDPSGYDDLISRGNGVVKRKDRWDLWHYWRSPQMGPYQWFLGGWLLQEGESGHAFQLETELSVHLSDTLQIKGVWYPRWSRDWLLWRQDDQFVSYRRTQLYHALDVDWFPAPGHELRLKAQLIVIDADDGEPLRLRDDGELRPSADIVPALSVRNFGLQLRYLYRFGPQRELYVVYGRGGFTQDEHESPISVLDLARESLDLRDADQLLVKLRWGF